MSVVADVNKALDERVADLRGRVVMVQGLAYRIGDQLPTGVNVEDAEASLMPKPGARVTCDGVQGVLLDYLPFDRDGQYGITLLVLFHGRSVVEWYTNRRERIVDTGEKADETLCAALAAQHKAHSNRIDSLVTDAHEWADDNDLCGKFDEFMESHGLEPRERDFDVTINVALTRTITARSFAAACDSVSESDVRQWLGANDWQYEIEDED